MPSTVVGPGQVIAGRYRVERWLGQGGMGSVYQALQLSVQRTVALKRLVEEHLESGSHVERFEREALALSRLSHQSTVRLFDFGADERGCPFIVMEYLEGADLATDLERHGPMRWDQALKVGLQILGSLGEAHAAGIVHRDIKPANLFLCAAPEWPVVKVLDFGIAGGAETLAVRKLTLTGTVLGSAPYMSPEQAQGLEVGPATDLYSFGVVLFEMLTGRTPFEARTLTAQLLAKVLEAAPALRDVAPEVEAPAGVHALVATLLERDPAKRPASTRVTAEHLEALLASAAALPPLSRVTQQPRKSSAAIPKTQPMLVPRTVDEGWTPPTAPRGERRLRGAIRWSLGLAAMAASGAAWLWLEVPKEPEQRTVETAVALLPVSIAPATRGAHPSLDIDLDFAGGADALEAMEEPAPSAAAAVQEPRARPLSSSPEGSEVHGGASKARAPARKGARDPRPEPRRSGARVVAQAPPRPAVANPAAATSSSAALPLPALASPELPLPELPLPELASPEEPTPASPASPVALPELARAPDPSPAPPAQPAPAVTPETLLLPSRPAAADENAGSSQPSTVSGAPPDPAPFPEAAAPRAAAPEASAPETAPPARPSSAAAPAQGSQATDPRYWTITAARAAVRRGEITPAQRNEIVAGLQERRLRARARAARAYREGRIGFEELRDRHDAIDRRIEGW